MPYKIIKGTGARPYKIVRRDTGKLVGTSKTLANAKASIRARYMGEHGIPFTRQKQKAAR